MACCFGFIGAVSILLKAIEDTKSFFKTCVSCLAISLLQESHCVKIWKNWTLISLGTAEFLHISLFFAMFI